MTEIAKLIESSGNIVFFGGAGVSTESGIPDFRSTDGLYSQRFDYPPETILSADFFSSHTEEFFRFYREKMCFSNVCPNTAHRKLAALEAEGKLKAVVTQNIDGLHQAAGSKTVKELHGSIHRNYCMRCGKFYPLSFVVRSVGVPKCVCGGTVKPDVVLYGEMLESRVLSESIDYISAADMLIVGGTSLSVYPAAGLIDYYRGSKLVLINKTATPYDGRADLIVRKPIGEAFLF